MMGDTQRLCDMDKILRFESSISIYDYERIQRISLHQALAIINHSPTDLAQSLHRNEELNQDEISAIRLYTETKRVKSSSVQIRLNKALKSSDRNQIIPFFPYLKILIDGLLKLKSEMLHGWQSSTENCEQIYTVGKRFVSQSFISCVDTAECILSKNINVKVLFCIECKTAKSIKKYDENPVINEFILLPGTTFEIVEKKKNEHGITTIFLREIQSMFEEMKRNRESKNLVRSQSKIRAAFDSQYDTSVSDFNSFLKRRKSQNHVLIDFISKQRRNNSIRFPEHPLSMDDMEIVRDSIAKNKYWENIYLWKTFLEAKYLFVLLPGLKQNSKIISLGFDENRLSDDGTALIADFLQINHSVRNLYLNSNSINSLGAQSLAKMLTMNTTLTHLELSRNSLSDRGIQSIADALKLNQTLLSINLRRTSMTINGLKFLADSLRSNSSLIKLNIADNEIGDDGVQILCESLKHNTRLTEIDLTKTSISQLGAFTIEEFLLQSSTLIKLSIGDNSLGNYGVQVILSALRIKSTLKTIELDGTEIDKDLVPDISKLILINSHLNCINFSNNFIGDSLIEYLAKVIDKNPALRHLQLNNIQLTDNCVPHLVQILSQTQVLETIELVQNQFTKENRKLLEIASKTAHECQLFFKFSFNQSIEKLNI